MGKASIQGIERTIGKIFSEDYGFSIPSYQRPYAWTKEEANELLDDLIGFVNNKKQLEELAPYFLGSIVLIKGDTPDAKVVDGQHTTILLSQLNTFSHKIRNLTVYG